MQAAVCYVCVADNGTGPQRPDIPRPADVPAGRMILLA
jgi:hypothetical protein